MCFRGKCSITSQKKEMFATVILKGFQFKIHFNDVIITQCIQKMLVNKIVELRCLMMIGSKHETIIGR